MRQVNREQDLQARFLRTPWSACFHLRGVARAGDALSRSNAQGPRDMLTMRWVSAEELTRK
jgi:hypothetical protein